MTLFSPTSPFPFTLSQACLLKQTRKALSFPCPSFCLSPPWRIKYTVLVWGKVALTHIFFQTAFSLTWMYATQGACPVAISMMNEMPYLVNILLTASLLSMRLTSWHLSEKNKQCPFKKTSQKHVSLCVNVHIFLCHNEKWNVFKIFHFVLKRNTK